MSIKKVIDRYLAATRTDAFAVYEKDFANAISSALSTGYLENRSEPELVKDIEDIVNRLNGLPMRRHAPFEISTKSVFIHGNKSHVEFRYYGNPKQTEFGDLIFIISIALNGNKYFEKMTVNQFKKDSYSSTSASWDISNKEQLFLLSRFPTFRGVRGIIPKREYSLTDYSGCLGSYGLLLKPGDFMFVGAPRLDVFLGSTTRLKQEDLFDLAYGTEKYFLHYLSPLYRAYFALNLFGNYHFASNVFDFVHKYLCMSVGEPTFMKIGTANSQARGFLSELFSAIRVKSERQHLIDAANFAKEFLSYGYAIDQDEWDFRRDVESDLDGGGLGIVHTMINLLE